MAVASCDPQALNAAAACGMCIPPGFKPIVNVSLLNVISGVGASVSDLIIASTAFDRFNGSALGAEVYLLAQIAGLGSQTPSQLANAAKCFLCGRDGDLDDITTFLYASQAGGSTAPADLINGATSYQRLFGIENRVALYLTCKWAQGNGAVANCDVAALLTASRCFPNCLSAYSLRAIRTYLLCFINGNNLGAIIAPTGFLWQIAPAGTTVLASWNTPSAGVTSTELWTSTDNVNFSLTATIAAPGNSNTQPAPAVASQTYAKIRFKVDASSSSFTASQVAWGQVADWAARVITNGGAAVAQNTVNAANTFYGAIIAAGIRTKIYANNIFAPDNLFAAKTPFIKDKGSDPWGIVNFVAGDLTVNGLIGNAANKYLQTGFIPSTMLDGAFDFHLVIYNSTATVNTTHFDIGAGNNPYTEGYDMLLQGGGSGFADMSYNSGPSRCNGNVPVGWSGYNCATRLVNNRMDFYRANSVTAHFSSGNNVNNSTDGRGAVIWELAEFCINQAGVFAQQTQLRHSFSSIGKGLTAQQSSDYFNAIQAYRQAIGGGFT